MNLTESIGTRLDKALRAAKKTQRELAAQLGKTEGTISHWIQDRRTLTYEDATAVGEFLNVTPNWLIFGNEFEPMDDEEREVIEDYRHLSEAERAGIRAMLKKFAENKPAQKPTGKRTKKATAPTPSSEHASELHKSEQIRLEPEELHSFLDWMLGQVETMPAERPLTKACRKIATRLANENAPASSPETSGESSAKTDAAGKDAPSAAVPSPHQKGHKKGPASSSS